MTSSIKTMKDKQATDIAKKRDYSISICDEPMINYTNVIDKIMHRKEPYISLLVRRNNMFKHDNDTPVDIEYPLGVDVHIIRKIRDKTTNKLTGDEIEITSSIKLLFASFALNPEYISLIPAILGTDKPPKRGTYFHDLSTWMSTYYGAWHRPAYVYLTSIRPYKTKDEKQMKEKKIDEYSEVGKRTIGVKQKDLFNFGRL